MVTVKPAFSAAYCSRLIGSPLLVMPSSLVIESDAINADLATYPDGAACAAACVTSTDTPLSSAHAPATAIILRTIISPRLQARLSGTSPDHYTVLAST